MTELNLSDKTLSSIAHYTKYAKHIQEERRRETFEETVQRTKDAHLKKYGHIPGLTELIDFAFEYVFDKKVLPSMRGLQYMGPPIEINNCRAYNCAYLPIDCLESFSETMFLLLSGCGVGYSVQKRHINQLPELRMPRINPITGKRKQRRYLVGDSIEGWADAVYVLLRAYFEGLSEPVFDFSAVRKKGERIKTAGGKAPGPEPLRLALYRVQAILERHSPGQRLTSLEVHDIICFLADAVLAGGQRRSALIALFSFDDEEMLYCKSGNWTDENPQRMRANNTVFALRHRITRPDFDRFWKILKANRSGEPGIGFFNSERNGVNPCFEALLRQNTFCNLVVENGQKIRSQTDLNMFSIASAIIGTLQAGYTNFHYLREIWKENTEKDALLGVSITGIASGYLDELDLAQAAKLVVETNKKVAEMIGIRPAARTTLIKPEGTTSLLFNTASGIHDWYDLFYIRRITLLKSDPIYRYLLLKVPELVEDNVYKPHLEAFIKIPVKANPEGKINSSALDFLARVKRFNQEWVAPGHQRGDDRHNVSATCHVRHSEWDAVGDWVWENKQHFSGLSFFPYDDNVYVQAPHESISEEKFNELLPLLEGIDLSEIVEEEDLVQHNLEAACSGGICEMK